MFVDRAARSVAIEASRNPVDVFADMPEDQAGSKALYYASLVPLVEKSVDMLLPDDPNTPSAKLIKSPFGADNSGFDCLRKDITYTMQSHLAGAYFEPLYLQNARAAGRMQKARGCQPVDVTMQMQSGSALAVNTMVKLLEHVPVLTADYAPTDYEKSYPDIARRSHGPAWDLAMICAQRLIFAHEALSAGERFWAGPDHSLRPDVFKIERIGQYTTRIALKDFANLSPISNPENTLQDVECRDDATIGCPLTLRPQKFMAMWNWMIDVVEERELWRQAS